MAKKKSSKSSEESKENSQEASRMPERAKLEDIEAIVVDLAKKGNHPAKIGLILKEKYGVQKIKLLGKKITQILKENKISYDNDLTFVNSKLKKIESHYSKNKQDKRAGREIVRYVAKRKKIELNKKS